MVGSGENGDFDLHIHLMFWGCMDWRYAGQRHAPERSRESKCPRGVSEGFGGGASEKKFLGFFFIAVSEF